MEKKPAILFGTAKPPAAASDRPKIVVAGEPRTRIACTIDDLKLMAPEASRSVLDDALQAVNGINLDDHYFEDVVRFGADVQAAHGRLAEAQLAVAGDDELDRIRTDFLELIERLEALDPGRVFAHGTAVRGLKRWLRQQVTESSFAAEHARIQALVESISAAAPTIDVRIAKLARLSREHDRLAQSFTAYILAARFIVAHIDRSRGKDMASDHYLSQRDALESRATSLSASLATLDVGRQTLAVLAHGLDDLRRSGGDITREDLPVWYAAYTAALVARRMKSRGEGPFDALARVHEALMLKLKRKETP